MAQPVWITAVGSLGSIPEGIYYQQDLLASTPTLSNVPTVTAASSVTNRFTCTSTTGIYAGLNVMFVGTPFGGVDNATRYFVYEVYNSTEFSIAVSEFSTSPKTLTTGTGSMTAEFTQHVYYSLIAGSLPPGVQVGDNGSIVGVPQAVASIQGVPQQVSRDITTRFAIRAYTKTSAGTVDRINDRTFSLTITGQDVPTFVTPPGNVGTYYDGTEISIQIDFTDVDPADSVVVKLLSGTLPPGVIVTSRGLITGIITPLVGPPGTAQAGYDDTPKDQYPNDFTTRSTSQNFQFALEVTDGKDSNVRTFEIFVYSKDSMSADTIDFTADNTWITADVVPTRTPVLLTPEGDLGRVRADNYFFFKFDAIDFDGDAIEYSITTGGGIGFDETLFDQTGLGFDRGTFSLPPGLSIDSDTGWFYGYIPDQGATETSYRFAIRVLKVNQPTIISGFYYFTITIVGNIDTEVVWLTDPDLGTINNGGTSTFAVEAVNVGNRSLQYRLLSGSNSKLPQGLSLLPSGHIAGRVSFNTFALDGGTTTFDEVRNTRLDPNPTTFDLQFSFDVNAFAPQTERLGYAVDSIVVLEGGSGYTSQPTITIGPPPTTESSIQATAGLASISGGIITAIDVGNAGQGYETPPSILITGGGGSGVVAVAQIVEYDLVNAVSVVRRFTITVNRAFNEPYESLYIKCMPPQQDRNLINSLIQNQDIISESILYRSDDPNFGVAQNVTYVHALGLNPASLDIYVQSLALNHYWRSITLGQIRTAQALDSAGNVLYEVVYSEIIDDLLNNQGISVGKQVTLAYPVVTDDGTVDVVYPNSLPNMRDQVINTVGQITPALPLWMTSKQTNGQVLGFVPAWVICYTNPGESKRVAYDIQQYFGTQLNLVDFEIDRYELDRSQTHNWNSDTGNWIPSPPEATTFDVFSEYLYNTPSLNTTGQISDTTTYTGNGTTVYFAISLLPSTGTIIVTVDDVTQLNHVAVIQEYSTDYTVNFGYYPKFVTFKTAPVNGSVVKIYQISDISVTNQDGTSGTPTIFDGGSMKFNSPADRWTETDEYDKYLVFPKRTILG